MYEILGFCANPQKFQTLVPTKNRHLKILGRGVGPIDCLRYMYMYMYVHQRVGLYWFLELTHKHVHVHVHEISNHMYHEIITVYAKFIFVGVVT